MKMRTRLVLFGVSLVGLFALVAVSVWALINATLLPAISDHLEQKLDSTTSYMEAKLDVGMAAGDLRLIGDTMNGLSSDEDIAYAGVFDAEGTLVYEVGDKSRRPENLMPREQQSTEALLKTQAIEFEGLALGTVAVVVTRERVLGIRAWSNGLLALGALVLALSCLFVFRYARQFVEPITEAIGFCRRVASGNLDSQLELRAPGELGDLVDDLNAMSHALHERDVLLDAKRTELAESLAALRTAQSKLVATSRAAGKAEIATNVLHNIGNTLNSTITTCAVVRDSIRAGPVGGLRKANELMEANKDKLGQFFNSARGRLLHEYLGKVGDEFVGQRDLILSELERQQRSIEHIARIVAAQQSQTSVHALVEAFDLRLVCEDVVALCSTRSEAIRIDIDQCEDLELFQDRNKLLEILTNLATNAVDALRDMSIGGGLRMTARLLEDEVVEMTVSDNGCGIPAEIINQIFVHGFSTKPEGHGFGLHFCVNAARQLGGDLSCESGGENQGATFTLTVPKNLPPHSPDTQSRLAPPIHVA